MSPHAIQLITVTREFGAGGSQFAGDLGARLGWPVLDHEIVHRIAAQVRVDDATVEHFDEHPPSLLARIANLLVIPQPELYEFPPPDGLPGHDQIAHVATRVIQKAGASPPLIVVGHGSQCIFAGRPDALHVFLYGPFEARVRRIVGRLGVDPGKAPAQVRRADIDRPAYVQRYFHTDWHDGALYDLQFNMRKLTVEDAVAAVERLVRQRMPAAADVKAPGSGPGGVHAG